MKTMLSTLSLAVVLGLTGCAPNVGEFCSRYDTGGDGLTEDEFYARSFAMWDADSDNRLEEEEFDDAFDREPMRGWGGSFGQWDQNDDGYLTPGELVAGFEAVGAFEEWDEDGDGELDELECEAVDADAIS